MDQIPSQAAPGPEELPASEPNFVEVELATDVATAFGLVDHYFRRYWSWKIARQYFTLARPTYEMVEGRAGVAIVLAFMDVDDEPCPVEHSDHRRLVHLCNTLQDIRPEASSVVRLGEFRVTQSPPGRTVIDIEARPHLRKDLAEVATFFDGLHTWLRGKAGVPGHGNGSQAAAHGDLSTVDSTQQTIDGTPSAEFAPTAESPKMPQPKSISLDGLNERNRDILKLWQSGYTAKAIAGRKCLSISRIQNLIGEWRSRFGSEKVLLHRPPREGKTTS